MSRSTTSQTRRARFVLSRLERLEAAASRAYQLADSTPMHARSALASTCPWAVGPEVSPRAYARARGIRLKRAETLLAAAYREYHASA